MLVGRMHGPLDREGQPLDRVAFKAEVRFAEARGEACAEDLELAMLLRQPELDAVPVEPSCAVPLARRDRRRPELADMLGHLGIIMMREHRDVAEHVVKTVGRFEIIELVAGADEIAHRKHALAEHREKDPWRKCIRDRNWRS